MAACSDPSKEHPRLQTDKKGRAQGDRMLIFEKSPKM
jgi:hypothetical protein